MIQLPNQCHCSHFNVYPKNWNSPRASVKKDWYITYRFYDPLHRNTPKFKNGKLVMIKGMNHFKTLPDASSIPQPYWKQNCADLRQKIIIPLQDIAKKGYPPFLISTRKILLWRH